MPLGTPLAVLLAILFLIPGFIWRKSASAASRYAGKRPAEWYEYFTLSCFNYLLALPAMLALLKWCPQNLTLGTPGTWAEHPFYFLWWMCVVFVLPVFAGVGTAKLAQASWLLAWLQRFGVLTLHPAPTAWDYAFSRDERYWARIELSDGKLVEGIFDSNSLASGAREQRDIFLEAVFELDEETGEYEPLERNEGVWVSAGAIRTITFFRMRAEEDKKTAVAPRAEDEG